MYILVEEFKCCEDTTIHEEGNKVELLLLL